jgi:transcriptional regulator with XRE-family HTH domain
MPDMLFSPERAKAIREACGLSRVAAAKGAELSRQGLINIEDGVSVPGVDTLGRLANAYGASVGDFFIHAPDGDMSGNGHVEPAESAA